MSKTNKCLKLEDPEAIQFYSLAINTEYRKAHSGVFRSLLGQFWNKAVTFYSSGKRLLYHILTTKHILYYSKLYCSHHLDAV